MKNTLLVSFPRSGHHLLVNMLLKYFGNLDYSEIQGEATKLKCKKKLEAGKFSYCEYYNHCLQIPCVENAVLQKNHDFELQLDPLDDYKYIVIYRRSDESIVSLYEFMIQNHGMDNSLEKWHEFSADYLQYWKKFYKKWVGRGFYPKRLVFSYEELIKYPSISLLNAILFIYPDEKIDCDRVRKIVDIVRPEKRRNIEDFVYYDKEYFALLNEKAKGGLF